MSEKISLDSSDETTENQIRDPVLHPCLDLGHVHRIAFRELQRLRKGDRGDYPMPGNRCRHHRNTGLDAKRIIPKKRQQFYELLPLGLWLPINRCEGLTIGLVHNPIPHLLHIVEIARNILNKLDIVIGSHSIIVYPLVIVRFYRHTVFMLE